MAETVISDITQTTFNREIMQVINGPGEQVFNKWRAILQADKTKVNIYYFNGLNNVRDYVNQYTDAICVDVVLSDDEYQRMVVPNRHKLRIRLFKEPVTGPTSEGTLGPTVSQEYVAMLYDNSSSIMESNRKLNATSNASRAELITVRIFLLNRTIENLRLRTLGTNVRETVAAEAIRGILHQETTISANNVSEIYSGLDLVPGYNTQAKTQIMIPHGTPVIGENSLVRMIEEGSGGVYNSGFNYYFQKGYWYMFPPFNTSRYGTSSNKTLTIINVPQDRFPNIEKSFRTTNNQVIILSTGASAHQDTSGSAQKNEGNAVMYVDADMVYNDFYKMEGDKLIVDSSKNVNKFGLKEGERTTNTDEVVMKNRGVTSKYFKEFSKLSLKLGMVIGCKWENADPDLIYPGMPVRLMYLDGDRPRQVFGSVIGVSIIVTAQGQGNGTGKDARRFATSVLVTVYIANKIDIKPS